MTTVVAVVKSNVVVRWGKYLYWLGRSTYEAWRQDRTMRLGAGLAYYFLFTLVPFVALTAAVVELIFGRNDVVAYLRTRVEELGVPEAEALAEAIGDAIADRSTQASLGAIGLVSLLIAASLVFQALVDAVRTIWRIPVGSGLWNSIRRRLLGFLMVFVAVSLLMVDFMVSAVTGAARAILPGDFVLLEDMAELVTSSISWLALVGALALLYRFPAPEVVSWRIAVASGTAAAAAMVAGSWAFGLYFRFFGSQSLTGAFGAIVVLLTWVYYQAQIVLFGVQLAKQLSQSGVGPPKSADTGVTGTENRSTGDRKR